MNVININGNKYLYESYWKKNAEFNKLKDLNNVEFPNPMPTNQNWDNSKFIKKLNIVESLSKYEEYSKHKQNNRCLLCGYKENCKLFTNLNIRWESILTHYINIHNIKPSNEFIDFIFNFDINNIYISRVKGKKKLKNKQYYLKISKNQLNILDALMYFGGKKIYGEKERKIHRFSEHSGILQFDGNKLKKIIVFTNTKRVDDYDPTIYLPNDNNDLLEYEYFFHTHPPTPNIGGRIEDGILYEFPSVNDIFHFIDHYNDGKALGSIVITPEGLYNIRKNTNNKKKIKINEDDLFNKYQNIQFKYQKKAIKKYFPFNEEQFFSVIAQDTSFINKLNDLLKNFDLCIDYFPRIKDNDGYWHINTIYIPIYN